MFVNNTLHYSGTKFHALLILIVMVYTVMPNDVLGALSRQFLVWNTKTQEPVISQEELMATDLILET